MDKQGASQFHLSKSLFRAYDIRGIVGHTLNSEIAFKIGKAFADLSKQLDITQVCIAYDARLSSPELYESFCEGLHLQGIEVIQLGLAPVSLPYFYMSSNDKVSAVMVTGSHNPPNYNGFKLFIEGASLTSDQLNNLYKIVLKSDFKKSKNGSIKKIEITSKYLEKIKQKIKLDCSFKVVIDGGNGAAGQLACNLFETLGCEVVQLFCKPDGRFPNHHPDPSNPENLEALKLEVHTSNADIGFAFDGDGDRLGIIDNMGNYVWPEHILMLLAESALRDNQKSKVIFDIKSSRNLVNYISNSGGIPIITESGYTKVKEKMINSDGIIGGEFSGHFFLRDDFFNFDDAIFIASKFLELISRKKESLNFLISKLPQSIATTEFHMQVEEGHNHLLMRKIKEKAQFSNAKLVAIDGLRVEFEKGWGLVRASNTTPSLNFRFEADSLSELDKIKKKFRTLINVVLPNKKTPF